MGGWSAREVGEKLKEGGDSGGGANYLREHSQNNRGSLPHRRERKRSEGGDGGAVGRKTKRSAGRHEVMAGKRKKKELKPPLAR